MTPPETQPARVVVFGSSGFVGQRIVSALEQRGVAVVRMSTPRAPALGGSEVAGWVCEAQDLAEGLAAAISGVRAVINAAGIADAGSADERELNAANAASAALIAVAARQAGIGRLVHVSSAAVQGSLPLDETRRQAPFSPYSRSKALGERLVSRLGPAGTVIYRPPGVHALDRGTTRAVRRLAASRFALTVRPGSAPTPQALVENVADAVAFLALHEGPTKSIVLHPWEGMTTSGLLRALGGREPAMIPARLAGPLLHVARWSSRIHPRLGAHSRRLEILWAGQEQGSSWLAEAGWAPPLRDEGWRALAVPAISSRGTGLPKVVIVSEHRCWPSGSGQVLGRKTLTAVSAFGQIADVVVIARPAPAEPEGVPLLESPHQTLLVPWPTSITQVSRLLTATRLIWHHVGRSDGVVVYCPGIIGTAGGLATLVRRRKLITVVVGDPSRSLDRSVVGGAASAVAKPLVVAAMRLFCRMASVSRYVTAEALQQGYPPGRRTRVVAGSDVGAMAVAQPRSRPPEPISILTVGTLDREYKGIRELISAVSLVRARGHDVRLRIAGTGRLEPELRGLASAALGDDVEFVGHVTGEALTHQYRTSDLFVLASWTEGLPRVVVEAMAAGMPCVATAVGGVPELLEAHRLVPPRDVVALARAIEAALDDPDAWLASSLANLAAARAVVDHSVRADAEFVDATSRSLATAQ